MAKALVEEVSDLTKGWKKCRMTEAVVQELENLKSVAKKKRFCVVRSVDLEARSCATVKDLADPIGENRSDILTLVWQELSYF